MENQLKMKEIDDINFDKKENSDLNSYHHERY